MKSFLSLSLVLAMLAVVGCASDDAESRDDSAAATSGATDLPTLTVYKSPNCGCCSKWADHMEQAGFPVERRDMDRAQQQQKQNELGVPRQLRSCHTAEVEGEVFEGHIPAEVVKQYLAGDTDRALGLAVPGMPVGSPGMENPNRPSQPYEVFAFRGDGRAAVYSQQRP